MQWTWKSSNSQKWRISQVSPGTYKFINVHSGKALDIYRGLTNNGTPVNQFVYRANTNQHWAFTPMGSGYYKVSPVSNLNASIDVPAFSGTDGAIMQQYGWNGGDNQQWNIVPVL